MTPEYASPELLRGEPATTASDVYQIGLLLYELLTGVRAQSLAGASAAEAERIVCQIDPPLPSVAVRSTPAAARARRLRGDLDAIDMKAIRKEPEQRYATPLDRRRSRAHIASSRSGRAAARSTGRVARRNRAATLFAATLIALLAGFGAPWRSSTAAPADPRRARRSVRGAQPGLRGRSPTPGPAVRSPIRRGARQHVTAARRSTTAGRIGRLGDQPEVQAADAGDGAGLHQSRPVRRGGAASRDALALVERMVAPTAPAPPKRFDSLARSLSCAAAGDGEPFHGALAIASGSARPEP
jgi:hypothetical protein